MDMHRVSIEFGLETPIQEKPIRVLLDDMELSGVSEVKIVSNDDGVTSVSITLIATVVAEIALLTLAMPAKAGA
jgi:hypothetical protein